jgi:hypothetical protein
MWSQVARSWCAVRWQARSPQRAEWYREDI